jgi:hypothetical protein
VEGQRISHLDRRASRRIFWKILTPDQLELVEIGGIDEVDVCLEHMLKRAPTLGENGLELL